MEKMKLTSVVALAATVMVGSTIVASAQEPLSDGGVPVQRVHGHSARISKTAKAQRPLTVTKPGMSLGGVVTAPIAVAGQIATAPLNGLSQAFGFGAIGGPSKPLPIVARYAGVGPTTDSVSQGWAQPVPLSANGPVYKLDAPANAGGISPFALIAAPITAATTIAAAPFNAVGAVVGAPPPPPPVF